MTTRRTLDKLIVACNDDIHAQSAAARVVSGAEARDGLERSAGRRAIFVDELSALVRAAGGRPAAGGSLSEMLRGGYREVRALVIGDNTGDAYAWCESTEGRAEELYERALLGSLPTDARPVVQRQLDEIASDRADLRRRRSGG